MERSVSLRLKALLALGAACLTLCMAMMLGSASTAKAYTTSNYCGGWLGAWGMCIGKPRNLFAVAGLGTNYGVCVWIGDAGGGIYGAYGCIGGNQWVYRDFGATLNAHPIIDNNSGSGSNYVHGLAYQP